MTAGPTRPRAVSGRTRARGGPSFVMVVPALAFFVLFAAAPLLIVGVLSLTEWDGLGAPTLAGLVNWREIAADPVVRGAVWLSVKVTILSWLVQTPLSLLLGVFIAGRQRYRAVFAVLYFVPLLLSTAAIAITWKDLLDPNFGLGSAPGLGWISGDWLGDQDTALYAVVLVIAWQFVPFHTLLYQAGTRQIPAALYEAAEIDGAGRLNQFWHITLPQLRYTIVTSSTLILVGSLTYFDLVFVMTGGGPGFATRILPLDMYITGFTTGDMGKASATAMVLVLAGLLLALGVVRYSGFGRMRSQQEGM